MHPKNIIFDIGNVLVKWAPKEAVEKVFPDHSNIDELTLKIFKSELWYDLNKGKLIEKEAIKIYHEKLGFPIKKLEKLMEEAKETLTPIEGSFELLEELHKAKIPLYCITDNVREIVAFLKKKYTFFDKFKGIALSADLGVLKPAAKIYHYLLKTYHLHPQDSIFFDDVQMNVDGAKAVGIISAQFTTAACCRDELKKQGFIF